MPQLALGSVECFHGRVQIFRVNPTAPHFHSRATIRIGVHTQVAQSRSGDQCPSPVRQIEIPGSQTGVFRCQLQSFLAFVELRFCPLPFRNVMEMGR